MSRYTPFMERTGSGPYYLEYITYDTSASETCMCMWSCHHVVRESTPVAGPFRTAREADSFLRTMRRRSTSSPPQPEHSARVWTAEDHARAQRYLERTRSGQGNS